MRNILVTLLLLSCLLTQAQVPVWTKIELTAGDSAKTKFAIIDWRDVGMVMFLQPNKIKVVQLPAGRTFFPNAIYLDGFDKTKAYNVEFRVVEIVNEPPPPAPIIQKVDGESATFTGTWARTPNNPTWYLGTIAYSNTVGATASYTFNGTKIEIWAERLVSHGTGTVKIDTGAEVPVAFNTTPLGLPVKIYESATLPLGNHTIVLKCVSGYVLLDYFSITK